MAETMPSTTRPDVDILADIEAAIGQYPPMVNDRRHVKIVVLDGAVSVFGHVKTAITCTYLQDTIAQIEGVRSVDISALYNDDTIRRDIGSLIPFGVWANVEYGHVILTGRLSGETDPNSLINQVRSVPGVRDVRTKFMT